MFRSDKLIQETLKTEDKKNIGTIDTPIQIDSKTMVQNKICILKYRSSVIEVVVEMFSPYSLSKITINSEKVLCIMKSRILD